MAQNNSLATIQFCALRIARLAANGSTPAGAGNGYVTNQVGKLTVKPNYEKGQEFALKNGCGALTTVYKDRDVMKYLDLTMELEVPDPEIAELLTGSGLISASGFSIGSVAPALGTNPNTYNYGVSIEAWAKRLLPGGAQDPTYPYERFVFPNCNWNIGEKVLENADMKVLYDGFGFEPTALYGTGPWADLPVSMTRSYAWFHDTTIPTATVGYVSVPA